MSPTDHEFWTEAVGSYALGAMPDRERNTFVAHLESCQSCQAALEHLRPAVESLPAATAHIPAPPELRERLMTTVRAEAELLRAAGPEADRPARRRAVPWILRPRPLSAALAAAALLVAGIGGFVLRGSSGSSAHPRVVAAKVAGAPNGSARIVVSNESTELRVAHLPAPPVGRVYQVWVQRGANARPAATKAMFTVEGDGSATVRLPSLRGVTAVMVTHEPAGGSRSGVPSQRVPIVVANL